MLVADAIGKTGGKTGGTVSLILCGGTISSAYEGDSIVPGRVQEMALDGIGRTLSPFTVLSENMTSERLETLYQTVRAELERTDCSAVVLTHGTDTLCYTAAYLGLRLAGIQKPVFLLSSDFPLSNWRANGHANLALTQSALHAAALGELPGGVYVPYKNRHDRAKLHLGVRMLDILPFTGQLFSAGGQTVGGLKNGQFYRKKDAEVPNLPFLSAFMPLLAPSKQVACVVPDVGLDYVTLSRQLQQSNAVLVLCGTHSGTVKTEGKNSAQALENIETYLACGMNGPQYASLSALPPSVVPIRQIAPVALYQKVRLACAYLDTPIQRQSYLLTNTVGEFF